MGRTGKLFAHEWAGITPDIMAVAKGIGGGFPLGACLATERAAKGMTLGSHGSTFGGNPLAMAVGNAVLDVVLAPSFLEHVRRISGHFQQQLAMLPAEHPDVIAEVRGQGLLLGLKLNVPNAEFLSRLRDNRMLAVGATENVIRIVPPLIVDESHLDEAMAALYHDLHQLRGREEGQMTAGGNKRRYTPAPPSDFVLPFDLPDIGMRGRLARLGAVATRALSTHPMPEPAQRALGEALTLAALLGSSLKLTGRMSVQTKSDGPLNLVVGGFFRGRRLARLCAARSRNVLPRCTGECRFRHAHRRRRAGHHHRTQIRRQRLSGHRAAGARRAWPLRRKPISISRNSLPLR